LAQAILAQDFARFALSYGTFLRAMGRRGRRLDAASSGASECSDRTAPACSSKVVVRHGELVVHCRVDQLSHIKEKLSAQSGELKRLPSVTPCDGAMLSVNLAQSIVLLAESLRAEIADGVGLPCSTLHVAIGRLRDARADRLKELNLLNHAYTGVHHLDLPGLDALRASVREFLGLHGVSASSRLVGESVQGGGDRALGSGSGAALTDGTLIVKDRGSEGDRGSLPSGCTDAAPLLRQLQCEVALQRARIEALENCEASLTGSDGYKDEWHSWFAHDVSVCDAQRAGECDASLALLGAGSKVEDPPVESIVAEKCMDVVDFESGAGSTCTVADALVVAAGAASAEAAENLTSNHTKAKKPVAEKVIAEQAEAEKVIAEQAEKAEQAAQAVAEKADNSETVCPEKAAADSAALRPRRLRRSKRHAAEKIGAEKAEKTKRPAVAEKAEKAVPEKAERAERIWHLMDAQVGAWADADDGKEDVALAAVVEYDEKEDVALAVAMERLHLALKTREAAEAMVVEAQAALSADDGTEEEVARAMATAEVAKLAAEEAGARLRRLMAG